MSFKLDPAPANVRFYYIKSGQFRVLHVDGILGGITPKGLIHIATYRERPAIPQTSDHAITPQGDLSPPVAQEGKAGIVREMDADLILSRQTAVEIRDWLTQRIEELEKLEHLRAQGGSSDA